MAEELTDEQKKARRAEINRQNAQKSTGPKSEIGKMNVRLNGLKHGARSKIIDMSLHESLVLLPTEGPTAYKKLLANYADKLQPRDEVEVGLVQRIGDLQWAYSETPKTSAFSPKIASLRRLNWLTPVPPKTRSAISMGSTRSASGPKRSS